MGEEKTLVRAASELRRARTPALVATVVRVRGSAYRRPGARMLVADDRQLAGSVSGGCLERDLLSKGAWRMRNGDFALVTYDSSVHDDAGWAFGLGCGGVVDVLLERLDADPRTDPLRFIARCLSGQQRGAIVTVFRSAARRIPAGSRLCVAEDTFAASPCFDGGMRERLGADALHALRTGETRVREYKTQDGLVEALVEAIVPPPTLFVLGAGQDAVPVAETARILGWDVVVWEPQARFATRARFAMADVVLGESLAKLRERVNACATAAAVVMGHNYEQDGAALEMLLGSHATYIGVLGPRRRTLKMLSERKLDDALTDERLHSPIGLDLGAESPAEIAIAALAEVKAELARTAATSLRERSAPIHAAEA